MRHLNVSLTVWAKSQDSVHKPQFLKRKKSRIGSNRGPSAYQPRALALDHTGSHLDSVKQVAFQWVSRQGHGKCISDLRDITNTIFFSFLNFSLERELSERLLFLFLYV